MMLLIMPVTSSCLAPHTVLSTLFMNTMCVFLCDSGMRQCSSAERYWRCRGTSYVYTVSHPITMHMNILW